MGRRLAFILIMLLLSVDVGFCLTGNSGSANGGFGYYITKAYYSKDDKNLLVEGFLVNSTRYAIARVNRVRLNVNGADGSIAARTVTDPGLEMLNLKPGSWTWWNFVLPSPTRNRDLSRLSYNVDCDYENGPEGKLPSGIKVYYRGEQIRYDIPPSVIEGRTLIPVRMTFEKMGASVQWNASTQTATVNRGSKTVVIQAGQSVMHVNGEAVPLEVSARVLNGRILIPLRAVATALECAVNWGHEDQMIVIVDGA